MSETKLHPFADVDEPLVWVDASGHIGWSNEAASRAGLTPASGLLRDLVLPDEAEKILDTRAPSTVRVSVHGGLDWSECLVVPVSIGAAPGGCLIAFQRNSSEVLPVFAREEFLATVAHDLKNPLGAVFSYADALLDTSLGEGLNEKQRHTIGRMRATALRSIDLVRNYQHLSQLKAGAVPAPKVSNDLNAAVSVVLEYCWRPEPASPRLVLNLARGEVPVFVERLPLERVVSNIFSNAVKYTPAGGAITVATAPLDSGGRLVVTNTGPGITAEERNSIFNRFKRGSAAAGTTGSGLGLYIVKATLDAIGAGVTVESVPGESTTFTVTFPR